MANDALSIAGLIAGLAEVCVAVLAARGNGAFLSATAARPNWRLVTALTVVIAVDHGGDVVDATATCAGTLGPGTVTAQRSAIPRSGAGCS